MKKKFVRWLVKATDSWNKEFHDAIEANISAAYRASYPNVTDLDEIVAKKKDMRDFYYLRMNNTGMLLITVASVVISSFALLAAFVPLLLPLFQTNVTAPGTKATLPELACVLDWPGTASFFKDIIISGAAVFTAFVAYKGISKWRSEESGKADFELSRRIGKAIFRMRDVMRNARAPFVVASEFPEGYNALNATTAQKASAWAHVFNERWIPVRDCAVEIQTLRNEAEALWGNAVIPMLDKLLGLTNTLRVAMGAYIQNEHAAGDHFGKNPDFGKKIDAQLFDAGNEINADGNEGAPNAFTSDLDRAVFDAATYLRTKLPAHK